MDDTTTTPTDAGDDPATTAETDASTETPATTTTETTADAEQKAWFQSIWDAEKPGAFVKGYQELLPPEMEKAKATLANYQDFQTLANSHLDLLRISREKGGVKPLTPESTPEEVASFRKAMGIPDKPYEFPKPDKLPDGVTWNDDMAKSFGQWAQENNLNPAQAKGVLDLHAKFVAEDSQKHAEALQTQRAELLTREKAALREQFGGGLSSAVISAQQVASKYGLPPEIMEPGNDQFAGITVLRMAADLAAAMGESQLPSAASVQNMNPEREYLSIIEDKSNPLHKLWASGDKNAVKKVNELRKRALSMKK
jgi:hypothetical protein